jgi:hypothetical protein
VAEAQIDPIGRKNHKLANEFLVILSFWKLKHAIFVRAPKALFYPVSNCGHLCPIHVNLIKHYAGISAAGGRRRCK